MHIYPNTADNINPILSVLNEGLLDTSGGKDLDSYNAVSPNGVKVTSSAPTYGSAYALHAVMNGTTEGIYWLTSSSGTKTLTFDFADIGGVDLVSIEVAPYTRSDARSNYKISYTVVGDEDTWIDLHTSWVDTSGYKSGQYIRHALSANVSKVRFTLTQQGTWGVTLNDVQFYQRVITAKSSGYMFYPLIPMCDRKTSEHTSKDGMHVVTNTGKIDVYAYHEVFASSTATGSDVYFDTSKGMVVDVAYSENGGESYSEFYSVESGSSLPTEVQLSKGTVLKFRVRADIDIGDFIEIPGISLDVTGDKLVVAEFYGDGIIRMDVDDCLLLNAVRDTLKILVKDSISGVWGTLEGGKFTEVSRTDIATRGISLDVFNEWMAQPVRETLPRAILISFYTTETVVMRSFSNIKVSYSRTGADAKKATATFDRTKVKCTIVKPFQVVKRPSLGTALDGIDEIYALTTRVRPPKATIIKVFRPIPRAINNKYNGVYYSTGTKESMYQPRKSPLNWVPGKWNGQDI